MTSLQTNFQDSEIWIAATEWVKDIFSSLGYIKGTIPVPDTNSIKEIRRSAKAIETHAFDVGLLFTDSFSSALLFYLAKIPQRWGYKKDLRRLLLTKSVLAQNKMPARHQVDHYLDLISGLGLETTPPKLIFPLKKEEKKRAGEYLVSCGRETRYPLVVFSPGASYGPSKRWPASSFAQLGDLLQKRHSVDLAIIGSSEETELAEEISSGLVVKPMILTGKTFLRLTASIVDQAALFVTNDSGPMHMANALGIPTVAIFGPTDPERTRPYQEPASVVKKDVPCSPCLYRECPFDHQCMSGIRPADVLAACESYLK